MGQSGEEETFSEVSGETLLLPTTASVVSEQVGMG